MQVMYATALDTEPTIDRVRLMKEDENLRIGVRYLKQLLNRFDGNYALALAGYNAGPTAAARWLRDFKGKGLLEYIESITYKETREYVAAILRNYLWYSTRIEGKAPKKASSLSTLDPFWVEPNRKN
jgi:soluble lytic murein transglycosylase